MNWINKLILKYAKNLLERDNGLQSSSASVKINSLHHGDLESTQTINFKITPAQGGTILSISKYDSIKDRTIHGLHIISIDRDCATEIGNIVALELYKS